MEKYVKPEMEVIEILNDVVTVSAGEEEELKPGDAAAYK